jgi:hypothetical protein
MTRGDDRILQVTCTDKDDLPVDITDVFLWFTAKASVTDADSAAPIRKTSSSGIDIVDAAQGTATVTLVPSDTINVDLPSRKGTILYWDVQGRDVDNKIITLDRGIMVVEADVTGSSTP